MDNSGTSGLPSHSKGWLQDKADIRKALIPSAVAYNPNYIKQLLNLQKMNGFKKGTRI